MTFLVFSILQKISTGSPIFLYLYQKIMLSDWRGSMNIMCSPNEHQNVVFSLHSWARSTFQSAYKPKFRFFAKSSVFASGLLGELYSELFNEGISKHKMWAKMFPEIMLWKRMGLETDQNIVDTYFLISKRVQEDKISIFCKL